ncbi:MAG: neutral/alkaline ceramidase [Rhodococcus sp. (in: high G+C Gram-positive bacteria)]|uniref:neutral/alkaline ceramidase n=1 Tax=Rhodococcus sp. TaxID=1831 RepID=UPI003BB4E98A
MDLSRRLFLTGAAAGAAALAASPASANPGSGEAGYLVGTGIADMTGAVAGQGMMGYSDSEQVAEGLLQRCWARAYIVVDRATDERVVFVTGDIACVFQSHHIGLMTKLRERFGTMYSERNVNINATHTHASCGGTAWDFAYTLAAFGFKKNSYDAEVEGLFAAIERAHDDLAPGTIAIGTGELHNASRNRSQEAFDRNPTEDRQYFPESIDPGVTSLRLSRGGTDIGAITWFSTHCTSLTDANKLIAGDNKGYASYRWEREQPGIVAAFPQTNAGDMTPNLNLIKLNPSGPTDDHKHNCEIIGERQYRAGRAAFESARPMTTTGVDSIVRYIDISAVQISGDFTPDGKPARTSPAMMGAAAAATSTEDNTRSQLAFLQEGLTNPVFTAFGGDNQPSVPPWVRDTQAPKLILFPLGLMPPTPWVPQVVPLQILRIGELVLVAIPAEVTIVAGLRLRQVVADALKVPLDTVLAQGYSNSYTQYVTTPEEYDAQQYEGGETLFGRWTLSAYMQEFYSLAAAMAARRPVDRGPAPMDNSGFQPDLLPAPLPDRPIADRNYGDVVSAPKPTYTAGETVAVEFVGAHPNNNFRHGDSYLQVQRRDGDRWTTIADDNDWETTFRWSRPPGSDDSSLVRIEWIPSPGTIGEFRIHYAGDARAASGQLTQVTGTSPTFTVA